MEAPRSRSSRSRLGRKKFRKSGVRTKFLIESLRNDYNTLREENDRLRNMVVEHLPDQEAKNILAECFDLSAPRAKIGDMDELAKKVAGSRIMNEEDEGGFY